MEKNNERQDLFNLKNNRSDTGSNPFAQKNNNQQNECPKKDKDGNCLVPGVYRDSDEIGGG